MLRKLSLITVVILIALLAAGAISAQDAPPAAEIVNDEGGPVLVNGVLELTNPNIKRTSIQPIIILEDQAGFVDRDIEFSFPAASQVFAAFTSDFYADAPVSFELPLPAAPLGSQRDVDQDTDAEAGVQVYAISYWDNRYGEPFLNDREGYGWSTAYASTRTSIDPDTLYEVNGGRFLVYAPDDEQGFPSGFGDDGLLFTEDDPIVTLPAGWTLVDMDSDPFTFDRSRTVEVVLSEPEDLQLDDFSDMSYTEAFNAFIDLAANEYAFTELKNVDWEALREQFLPEVEAAEANNDLDAFILAFDALTRAVPDGHWQFPSMPSPVLDERFANEISGGYGLTLRELTDGSVIVSFITPGGPAEAAGIQVGALVTEFGGMPIEDAIAETVAFGGIGSPEGYRYQQARYLTRDPLGSTTEVTFQNPGSDAETVELEAVDERDSFGYASVYRGLDRTAPPLTYQFLDNGYGYVKITSFDGNEPLMIETFDYFMTLVRDFGVQGIIIDMRQNGGGFSFIGERIAGYFFREETLAGNRQNYNDESGEFFSDPNFPTRIFPAEDTSLIFDGPVAVLVGPGCASACEFFTYYMSMEERAAIVGEYTTAGLGGGWSEVYLPDGLSIALPSSRPVDADGNVIIEGTGIEPTVRVPVTAESVINDEDAVLNTGVRWLDEALGVVGTSEAPAVEVTETDGGEIALGETSGSVAVGERVRYSLTVEADTELTIALSGPDDLDTYLRVYDVDGVLIGENDDEVLGEVVSSLIEGLPVQADTTLTIEVGTFGDQSAGDFTLVVSAAE